MKGSNRNLKSRNKYTAIRTRLLEMLEQSSPMLQSRLTTGRVTEDWALRLFAGPRLRLTIQETDDVEAVQMFKTSDGATFEVQAEAEAHEKALLAEAEIDKFIASQEYKRGQGTHAKNVLMAFSAWKNGG